MLFRTHYSRFFCFFLKKYFDTENFGELLQISKSIEISLAFCRRAMVFSPCTTIEQNFLRFSIAFCLVVCVVKRPTHGGFRAKIYKRPVFLLKRVDFRLLRSFQSIYKLLIVSYFAHIKNNNS